MRENKWLHTRKHARKIVTNPYFKATTEYRMYIPYKDGENPVFVASESCKEINAYRLRNNETLGISFNSRYKTEKFITILLDFEDRMGFDSRYKIIDDYHIIMAPDKRYTSHPMRAYVFTYLTKDVVNLDYPTFPLRYTARWTRRMNEIYEKRDISLFDNCLTWNMDYGRQYFPGIGLNDTLE